MKRRGKKCGRKRGEEMARERQERRGGKTPINVGREMRTDTYKFERTPKQAKELHTPAQKLEKCTYSTRDANICKETNRDGVQRCATDESRETQTK